MAKITKKPVSEESRIKRLVSKMIEKKRTLFIGVIVVLVIQFFQVQALFAYFYQLELRDSSLITEIGDIKGAYTNFADDLNEIRNYLRLPTKDYLGFDDPSNEDAPEGTNEDALQLAIFNYAEYLATQKNINDAIVVGQGMLQGLVDSENVATKLSSSGLSLAVSQNDAEKFKVSVLKDETPLFSDYLALDEGKMYRSTALKEEDLDFMDAEFADFEADFLEYVEDNSDSLLKALETSKQMALGLAEAFELEQLQAIIAEKGISVQGPTDSDGLRKYTFLNKSGEEVARIEIKSGEKSFIYTPLEGESKKISSNELNTQLTGLIKDLNTLTVIERKVAKSISEVEATLKDKGFMLLLSSSGLKMSEDVREDDIRLYYDILSEDGTLLSSIVVEKATGVINIVDSNGTNSENILFFEAETKKKTLSLPDNIPQYDELSDDADGFNVLIAGKHGNLLDTMIFAHIDEERGDIRLLSIPRDLQYNGRKINSFAFYYGMPELQKVLSDITGYQLDKYILIDMYAFIDVIDLIGGVDITLTEPVIDPNYRTVDNGVVGTLHYEPGDYHLGGKEALRLARSRKTSSDFVRAERQQIILESIQGKAQNFGFGDADTIYALAKSILEKVETDIGFEEAIAYYFRYQNYEMTYNRVMSSGNVLYAPPYITTENCNAMVAAAQASGGANPGCSGGNHAYILIPRNEDWNIIKWYFREVFEPEVPEV